MAFISQLTLRSCQHLQSHWKKKKAWTRYPLTRSHAPLPSLLLQVDTLKRASTLESFYSIRSFTALFMLRCSSFLFSFFFPWRGQGSWKSANESLMDRMEQSKCRVWPPPAPPSLLPLPGAVWAECSDQHRLSAPPLNGGDSFQGGLYLLMAKPVNNAVLSVTG